MTDRSSTNRESPVFHRPSIAYGLRASPTVDPIERANVRGNYFAPHFVY